MTDASVRRFEEALGGGGAVSATDEVVVERAEHGQALVVQTPEAVVKQGELTVAALDA
jgi:hypothetical protein